MIPEEQEAEDEVVATALGQMMMGEVELARQTFPSSIFNEALRQAKSFGYVDESVPEEPE